MLMLHSLSLQELQFQEQQEELRRELQQRSTQQLLEQSYNDNSNSKNVDFDYYRRTYEKPQLITNLTNLNYQSSSNYNTINQSSAKDILYELKQYEHFANSNQNLNHYDHHHHHQQHHQQQQQHHQQATRSYTNGTNYSQNILNYNNSYYKINNINNFNYIKNQSPSAYQRDENKWLDTDSKMERDESIVERSHLVKDREANGHNVTIHNFKSGNNNGTSTTVHVPHCHNIDDECEEQQQHQQHNIRNPINRSQHFTQVSFNGFFNFFFFVCQKVLMFLMRTHKTTKILFREYI
jgi:hypothetical protein